MRLFTIALVLACLVAGGAVHAAQAEEVESDRSGVYRLDPTREGNELVQVSPEEIDPGLAYNYYNERLSRRAWGFAREDSSFQYAFGEGTTLPLDRLDLGLPPDAEERLLEESSPGLLRSLGVIGARPSVKLTPTGEWRLLSFSAAQSVFDLETGHRWEWHGDRRAAVLHTFGDQWQVINGRYRPAWGALPIVPVGRGSLHRVGSAVYVTRTPELTP